MSPLVDLLEASFAGLVAAMCMTVVEIPFWKNWGMEGVAEWQVNSVMVRVVIRKFMKRKVVTSMVVAMHLFHGAAIGILFRVLLELSSTAVLLSSVIAYAIIFSVLLWIVSPFLTRRIIEAAGSFRMTRRGLAVSFLAHIVFGVCLGFLISIFA